jgi:RNA polymerase sigma-70 factor (ECF subfamily)
MAEAARRARDEWLALRCQLGEPQAFAELIQEMERPLLYYATKLLKDENKAFDVLQEVWLTVFRQVRRLREPRTLRTWIYRIAHGRIVDHIRQDVSREKLEKECADTVAEAEDGPSFSDEDAAAIHHALDALEARHREVLVLHFLEELPVAEVAAIVGCPEGTVKSRIFHAKKALKDALVRGGYGTESR